MIFLLALRLIGVLSLSCKDLNGNDVDWFAIVKPPKSASTNLGQLFMYIDPSHTSATIQPKLINDIGAISYTLSQLDDKSVSSVFFNDEPPSISYSPKSFSNLRAYYLAHAKGFFGYDSTNAFYVIHSFPLFPAFLSSGKVNTTINYSQMVYGQNMMCVSLPTSTLFQMAGIMSLIQPIIYHTNIVIPNSNITAFISDTLFKDVPSGSYSFQVKGNSWVYMSKTAYSGLDFWDKVAAVYFKQGMNVQSWGRPYMPSLCPPTISYPVLNIANLKISDYSWTGTNDHSKWGIPTTTKVVCYGDMNRMYSQEQRGGGALCFYSDLLYGIHSNMITGVNPCNT